MIVSVSTDAFIVAGVFVFFGLPTGHVVRGGVCICRGVGDLSLGYNAIDAPWCSGIHLPLHVYTMSCYNTKYSSITLQKYF